MKTDFRVYFYIAALLYIPLFFKITESIKQLEKINIIFCIIGQLLPESNPRMARDKSLNLFVC